MGLYIAFAFISILFIITVLWLHYSLRSRFNVVTYTILLLLDDELKKQQEAEIRKWIGKEAFINETDMQKKTRFIITQLAQTFAQNKKSLERVSDLLRHITDK